MPPSSHNHRLFKSYPISGDTTTAAGPLPTPYHVYDGRVILIGGTGELGAAHELLKAEEMTPIRDTDGRALVALWICDFTDASLGAHKQLQISILVARQPMMPVTPHPLAVHRLLSQPGVGMMCHGLWNNTNPVIAYNREVLGLSARLADGAIEHDRGMKITAFSFLLAATNKPIASGMLTDTLEQPKEITQMLRQTVGLRGQLDLVLRRDLHVRVVNPVSKTIPQNLVADTYCLPDQQTLRLFDPERDTVTIEDEAYRKLGLWPHFVQHMEGFKFVHLNPRPWDKRD